MAAQAAAQHDIDAGEGLVHQQHLRARRHRPGKRGALLLAAGKLVRIARAHPGKPDLGEPAVRLNPPRLGQAKGDIGGQRHVREQRAVLKHQPHGPRLGRRAALRIGHIHLRVGGLETARAFYADGLGLDVVAGSDERGATFLSSGRYHHHIGANIWQSRDAGQRQDGMTGLDWFSLHTSDQAILDARRADLQAKGFAVSAIDGGFEALDPWGTRVRLLRV